jgi:hypothetical protein
MSFNFDFLLLLFVFSALFMVFLCPFLVARLKLPHALFLVHCSSNPSFSSYCQTNILCGQLHLWCSGVFFFVTRLISWYLVFC